MTRPSTSPIAPSISDRLQGAARVAGALLVLAALLTVVAMTHHPSGHGAVAGRGLSLVHVVHGAMMVVLFINLWGLTVFTLRRGWDGWSIAGLVAYAVAFVVNLGAATINGFVVPAVARQLGHDTAAGVFAMLWQSNQALAAIGVFATALALILWSVSLLRPAATANRVIALYGLVAATVTASLLATGVLEMDVTGATTIYVAQTVWIAAVGAQMIRREL